MEPPPHHHRSPCCRLCHHENIVARVHCFQRSCRPRMFGWPTGRAPRSRLAQMSDAPRANGIASMRQGTTARNKTIDLSMNLLPRHGRLDGGDRRRTDRVEGRPAARPELCHPRPGQVFVPIRPRLRFRADPVIGLSEKTPCSRSVGDLAKQLAIAHLGQHAVGRSHLANAAFNRPATTFDSLTVARHAHEPRLLPHISVDLVRSSVGWPA